MKIRVNSIEHTVDDLAVTYGKVIELSRLRPGTHYTVTYHLKREDGWERTGILRSGQTVTMSEDTVRASFNAADTSNA